MRGRMVHVDVSISSLPQVGKKKAERAATAVAQAPQYLLSPFNIFRNYLCLFVEMVNLELFQRSVLNIFPFFGIPRQIYLTWIDFTGTGTLYKISYHGWLDTSEMTALDAQPEVGRRRHTIGIPGLPYEIGDTGRPLRSTSPGFTPWGSFTVPLPPAGVPRLPCQGIHSRDKSHHRTGYRTRSLDCRAVPPKSRMRSWVFPRETFRP